MVYEEILSMSEALEITEISREKVSDPEEREKEDSDLKERRSRERRRVKKSEKGWIFGKLEQQGSFFLLRSHVLFLESWFCRDK
ncbi:hypothetical protein Bca101_090682 [Brassica carinata]